MRVLFVFSENSGLISPFIKDQANALEKSGVQISYFPIIGKGKLGYLKNIFLLRKYINDNNIDLIHSHYGLSGLVSSFQNKIPVVTTFHGSDINNRKVLPYSILASKRADYSIFVSNKLKELSGINSKCTVIPCGVDLELFKNFGTKKYDNIKILFSSSFERKVKNYPLAKKAIDIAQDHLKEKIELIELKGYNRSEVAKLMNKVNLTLLTSFTEGSPQFIKEAMACGCPAVATNVGDIEWLFGDETGYYISENKPEFIAKKIIDAIHYTREFEKTNGRQRIKELGLDNLAIAEKILEIYKSVL